MIIVYLLIAGWLGNSNSSCADVRRFASAALATESSAAAIGAGLVRFRPVLMTTSAMSIGKRTKRNAFIALVAARNRGSGRGRGSELARLVVRIDRNRRIMLSSIFLTEQ